MGDFNQLNGAMIWNVGGNMIYIYMYMYIYIYIYIMLICLDDI